MSSNYTGNPLATQSPASAPTPGVAPIIVLPADADPRNVATMFTQQYKMLTDYVAWLMTRGIGVGDMCGDGSDANLTFDGSTTILGIVPSSSVYTMTRDIYATNLTVNAGVTVKTSGYRVYCSGTLVTVAGSPNGKISAAGAAASTSTGGASPVAGTLRTGGPGASGSGSVGTNSSSVGNGYGGVGGNGGTTNGVGGSVGGTVPVPAARYGSPRSLISPGHLIGTDGAAAPTAAIAMLAYDGGSGGGSGAGGGGGNLGGGGGAGGGVLVVIARYLNLAAASDLTVAGGAGGNAVTQGGGGGGGGGGVLLVAYGAKAALTFSAATNCPGGAAGLLAGANTTNGTVGGNGTVFEVVLL